ncbi:MAG: DNA gyrase subunit A [Candidatus Nomurabacteria bacterium]|nr:DNA gyrase subunit A [Candidatus Nomurabacteria bacterium]
MDKKKVEQPTLARDNVVPINITDEMKESFLAYSMSVIMSRALPDVRDGLKPVHRRILFAMHGMGLAASAKFRKSAAVVGDVLGKYHPHGDTSVYDAMVNMAQEFSYRYPMVWGQGNFGSIDGDNAAAMRYTEAKMTKIAGEMMSDIEKETVDFVPNYDDTQREPSVLPASVPALLLNGTLGIAVGMATNIPPHNLGEIVNATVRLIDEPEATNEDLMDHVTGPDFPTGGLIFGESDIAQAYATGRGGVKTRGEAEIVEGKRGSEIIITSIPYRVNKANLIIKIADLVKDKKLQGIRDLRDESTRDIRVVIELKSSASPQRVLNYIYKHTDLEQNFNFNVVALVNGVPQTLSLKQMLEEFIKHRQEVVRRRNEYDLKKAEARAHILEGLKKALDNIDAVIKIIKASTDSATAKVNLMKKFKFTEIQAQAILDMRLQKLAGLERKKIEDELREILKTIKDIIALLKSVAKMLAVIKDELIAIRDKYDDGRNTKVMKRGIKALDDEDLIVEAENVLVFTAGGYVKRTDPVEFKKQKRGGVGVVDLDTKEEDVVTELLTASTLSDILFFTDAGKAYQVKMYELPEGKRATRGKSIMNYIQLSEGEKVTSILAMPKDVKQSDVKMVLSTKEGVTKKISADSFKNVRSNGIIALKLGKEDTLLSARFVSPGDYVVMMSHKGQSIRFAESDLREMGRAAGGVRGMKLGKGDYVVGVGVVRKDSKKPMLLVMSENGYGKQTKVSEYKIQKRGGSGIKTMNITTKTGALVSGKIVTEDNVELIAISKKSQVIRIDISDVSELGRATQGVRIMKLRAGDSLASVTLL